MKLKKLNNKGSGLLWVFVMLIIISLVFLNLGSNLLNNTKRTLYNLDEEQTYLTARSMVDYFAYVIETANTTVGEANLGEHILSYLAIMDKLTINKEDMNLPKEMGDCDIFFTQQTSSKILIEVKVVKNESSSSLKVEMIKKYNIYEKDTNILISKDYLGDFSEFDLNEITVIEYWVIAKYEK